MMRAEIKKLIAAAAERKFGAIKIPDFAVGVPENPAHGDYATNAAMVLARELKKPPMDTALALAAGLRGKIADFKTETVSPGFINFRLSEELLRRELGLILKKGERYGRSGIKGRTPRINIEFISANPTGPLTVGNGRGAFLGDVLSRVLELAGKRVVREFYINNARQSAQIKELGKTVLGRGEAYAGKYTEEIKKRLAKRFYKFGSLNEADAGYAAAAEIQKDNKKFIEKILKIKFGVWYEEEKIYRHKLVRRLVGVLNEKGALYEKDGALWFRARDFGDSEDRVAVRSDGAPTYFLPDAAYHCDKLVKRGFAGVIDVLGADHHGTFPRVLAGLKALGLEPERVKPIFVQMVRLLRGGKEVKMSKRRGSFVTLEELVGEVGLDACRYFFLEKSPGAHMDFDLDLAKERSLKNPVYYIQYAHARTASVFRKAGVLKSKIGGRSLAFKKLKEAEELALIKKLIQFPETIEDTAKDYQVHRLCRYAYELARAFHNFYEKRRVLSEDKELFAARLALLAAVKIVLGGVLRLLGIGAPLKM